MHTFLTVDECKDLVHYVFHKLGHPELIRSVPVEFSTRMTKTMGLAYPNTYRIKLSRQHFDIASPAQRAQTIIHEACHIIQFIDHRGSKPHGAEWKRLMVKMGVKPLIYHNVHLPGAKRGRTIVKCECTTFEMGPIRLKRLRAGKKYYCKTCCQPFKE
jgi:predicted SprT family Zn-dependent metalloprotease